MVLKAVILAGLLVVSSDASVLPRANYWHGFSKIESVFSLSVTLIFASETCLNLLIVVTPGPGLGLKLLVLSLQRTIG